MPDSALIILNPKAASGRTARLRDRLQSWLTQIQVKSVLVETRARGHAQDLAQEAASKGFERVIAVGGDGTLQEIVNGLMAIPATNRPSVGLVPAGRGNDAARSYHLPKQLFEALRCALGPHTRPVDLVLASRGDGVSRYLSAAGGVGFDAQVAYTMDTQRRFWMRGELGYTLATLNELRHFKNCDLHITVTTPEGTHTVDGRFLFTAFANGPFYGGGMQICPDAQFDDGLIDACMVGDLSRLQAIKELPGIYRAAHVRHPKVRLVKATSLRIEGDTWVKAHLDGEPFGTLPLEVAVSPRVLQVAMPAAQ